MIKYAKEQDDVKLTNGLQIDLHEVGDNRFDGAVKSFMSNAEPGFVREVSRISNTGKGVIGFRNNAPFTAGIHRCPTFWQVHRPIIAIQRHNP